MFVIACNRMSERESQKAEEDDDEVNDFIAKIPRLNGDAQFRIAQSLCTKYLAKSIEGRGETDQSLIANTLMSVRAGQRHKEARKWIGEIERCYNEADELKSRCNSIKEKLKALGYKTPTQDSREWQVGIPDDKWLIEKYSAMDTECKKEMETINAIKYGTIDFDAL